MSKIELPVAIRVVNLRWSLYLMTQWCNHSLGCRPILYTDVGVFVFLFNQHDHAVLFKLRFVAA